MRGWIADGSSSITPYGFRGARNSARMTPRSSERASGWAGPPAVARSVRLVYMDGPFTVPVPEGGAQPEPERRTAVPLSRLGWVVRGPVRGGPEQVIGVLDYASGRVAWDIRPLPGTAAR